jgi:hypothetical protein
MPKFLSNNIARNETEKLNRTDRIVQMIFFVNNELHNLERAQITILSTDRKNQTFLNIYITEFQGKYDTANILLAVQLK